MKPRNRYEREVEQLRSTFAWGSPKRWRNETDGKWIRENHTIGQTEYFAIFERVGDWQVIRMFLYRSWSKKHEALHEPLRYWIHRDGHFVIECKNRQCMGNYYIDPWIWDSEMAIRTNSNPYRDVRDLYCNHVKIRSLIPELKRIKNFRANNYMVKNLLPFWFTHSLITNNRLETLFKLNQKWLTWKFYHYDTDKLTEKMWQAIRVALRHGYHWDSKEEINDWCDYIYDLEKCGKDTNNPQFICPTDFKAAHQHYSEIIRKMKEKEAKIEREKRMLERIEKEKEIREEFIASRSKFLGMVITDGTICISVLPTQQDLIEEGKAMHHCVGTYTERLDSLILSAKINGERIETIEVNLNSFELVQSRGLQNKFTEYHEQIEKLMADNMEEIKRRYTQRKVA